jgi:hypothetical protein
VAEDAGSILIRAGAVSSAQVQLARQRVAAVGGTISESLVAAGAISDDTLTEFYRTRLMVPQVDGQALQKISPKTIGLIPADVAIECRVIPVSMDRDGNLTIAMSEPSNTRAVDELVFFTGSYVVRNVATQQQIAWCLSNYYKYSVGNETPALAKARTASGEVSAAAIAAAAAHDDLEPSIVSIEGTDTNADCFEETQSAKA